MVKIIEESKPIITGMNYLNAVERSIKHLEEYHNRRAMALSESDLTRECRSQYGEHWAYNHELNACVDERFDNSALRREGSEITVNTHTWRDQDSFRGTWGTPIQADNQLHTQRDSSGNAHTVIGIDPASKFPYGQRQEKKTVHIKI